MKTTWNELKSKTKKEICNEIKTKGKLIFQDESNGVTKMTYIYLSRKIEMIKKSNRISSVSYNQQKIA